ncbi:hypothetical protein DFH06DRAFT_1348764 [Mycena polygramma]|nr:hypothetical protein DFH06DRAFT_1348764 [Mycena polygramma]
MTDISDRGWGNGTWATPGWSSLQSDRRGEWGYSVSPEISASEKFETAGLSLEIQAQIRDKMRQKMDSPWPPRLVSRGESRPVETRPQRESTLEAPESYGTGRFLLFPSTSNRCSEDRTLPAATGVPAPVPMSSQSQRLLGPTSDGRPPATFAPDSLEGRIDAWRPTGGKIQREAHAKVAQLREKLAGLQLELATAELEAACADDVMASSVFALGAVGRMPVELWRMVLTMAQGRESMQWWARVCRYWREMIMSSPVGVLANPLAVTGNTPLNEIKTTLGALKRAGRVEVELHGTLGCGADAFRAVRMVLVEEALAVLIIHDFYHPGNPAVRQVTNVVGVAQIHTLCLEGQGSDWNRFPCGNDWPSWALGIAEEEGDVRWSLSQSDRLKHVTLIRMRAPEAHADIPWARLETYCELQTARIGGVVPASHLAQMMALKVLCLGGVYLPDDEGAGVRLEHLEEFSYILPPAGPGPGKDVLGGLDFPGLRKLRVLGTAGWDMASGGPRAFAVRDTIHRSLENFLGRCRKLEKLDLELQLEFSGRILVRYMRACPSLRHLRIGTCNAGLLNADLVDGLGDRSLVPQLETLVLEEDDDCYAWEEDMPEVAAFAREMGAMVQQRFAMGLKLLDFERSWRVRPVCASAESLWADAVETLGTWTRGRRGGWSMHREIRAEMERLKRQKGCNVAVAPFVKGEPVMEVID